MRPFPTERERAAYALGRADALKAAQNAEPLTVDQIKQMSQQEVIDRKDEVDAVMAGES